VCLLLVLKRQKMVECCTVVGFVVHRAVTMKRTVIWDVTPSSPVQVQRVSEKNAAFIFMVEDTLCSFLFARCLAHLQQ
jgi:hypothetical protein